MYSPPESICDTFSVASYGSSRADDFGYFGPISEDDFEDRLTRAIEATNAKSSKAKCSALINLCKALTSRYVIDFIQDRRVTLQDIVERSVKRGKGEEQGLGANLAALLFITFGSGSEIDECFPQWCTQFIVILRDASIAAPVRAKFATALGICCFIADCGIDHIDDLMDVFYSLFSASFHKGNGVVPTHQPPVSALHMYALQSWSLLLSIQSTNKANRLAEKHGKRIVELLDSSDVELRITAGETIALLCETIGSDFFDVDQLCDKLQQLATDSQKFRAKKERKIQRSSFRDVLKYIEDEIPVSMSIKFGTERLDIDSWSKKLQYGSLCDFLGSGTNHHLAKNELLRDIFELGPVREMGFTKVVPSKQEKIEMRMENEANQKARSKTRRKQRDKRSDVF